MGSVKVVLRRKKNKNGLYPIAIRITHNRRSSFIHTGQYVELKQWDEEKLRVKKHPNSARLNNLILSKTAEANDKLLELDTHEERISSAVVKSHIKKEHRNSSFFKLAEKYFANLERSGKHTRVSAERPMIKHFKEFLKGDDIDFRDISDFRLRGYQSFLRLTRDVTERTVVNHLVVIRTIFNLAIRDGLVDRKYYPFGKGKIVIKFPESVKIGLEAQEVKKLENLKLKRGSPRWHALNVWLFSFYFAGMRVSDVLRLSWSDFQNDRMFYRMGKNNKAGSLKIPEKAQKIFDAYLDRREKPDDTVFPELRKIDAKNHYRVLKTINNADKKFNKHLLEIAKLAGIGKPLTMHIARHTFGNISGENIPLQMLQKLYRHTSITTTINYQSNFAFKDADEALDTVVNF